LQRDKKDLLSSCAALISGINIHWMWTHEHKNLLKQDSSINDAEDTPLQLIPGAALVPLATNLTDHNTKLCN